MKIEGHYRTKTTLLHHRCRLDQFNYEQTLDKSETSAFSTKSAQCQKKKTHAITLNAVTVKIYRNATNRQTRYLKFN